jgi:hypothetical protein
MPKNDDKDYAKADKSKPICPYCRNTGFSKPGMICICICGQGKQPKDANIDNLFEMMGIKDPWGKG